MRTCALCNKQSPDPATHCTHCGADQSEHSARAVALAKMHSNPRVSRIRVRIAADACPACCELEGEYPKDEVPKLPVDGCSHPGGCRCFYEPFLMDIIP